MSDAKKEILFNKSMIIDKRNADFAYLRKGLFDAKTRGMYPSRNFYLELPDDLSTDRQIMDVLGSEEGAYDIKVIVETGSGTLNIYNLGDASPGNDAITGSGGYEAGAHGDDGVHIVTNDDKLYKVNHTNDDNDLLWTFTEARPQVAKFDGLYYWYVSSGEIYKQIDGDTPTIAFNDLGTSPDVVDFLNDQMVIFAQASGDVTILFWDKSDEDLFDKRIIMRNIRMIAAGTVDGRLMMVYTIGNRGNTREHQGEIIISAFDGEKFVTLNSIKAGQKDTTYSTLPTSCDTGLDALYFGINDNVSDSDTDLFQNYIYKVTKDGAIEVMTNPDPAEGEVDVVRSFYNFVLYATESLPAHGSRLYINEDYSTDFDDYDGFEEPSEYITNFLSEPYNRHKLDGVAVVFEKLFGQTDDEETPTTGEQLDIYYRISDRDAFTLLGTVTAQKVKEDINLHIDQSAEYASDTEGLPEQIYTIEKMPDGSPLPEFNEIQFKFVSKRGFSVIAAWYAYSYITRTTFT